MWKAEVAIEIYSLNQENLLVVSGKCLKNFSEQDHF